MIDEFLNTDCDYEDVEGTNAKLDDVKERTRKLGEDFRSIVDEVRGYVNDAQVKKISLTAIDKEVNVLKKTPIKY